MTVDEAAQLLAIMATFDGRTLGRPEAIAWAKVLDGVSFEEARDAAVSWYRRSAGYMQPSMVLGSVKQVREQARSQSDRYTLVGEYKPTPEDIEAAGRAIADVKALLA